ncbi:unnamed protein product [Rotaria magnacalcarata]|uniref:DNA-directed primase/polymerase protein n=2 Tax=Rotaria magnacalcarata TaxID=392030 RepID=A0A819UNY8_9BILA|nr:unnamed protein product [Rotaria magnacalcarata]CAF4098100.1 unnamed protein product [Rotaria magnacalcarata]
MKYRNFRNIAFTLAARHQYYIASQMYTCDNTSTSSFLYSGHKIKKIKEIHSSAAKQHHLLNPQQALFETGQITLFGITYAIGDVVLINDCVFPTDPVFGKILTIIVQNKIILLRLQLLQIIVFNQQLCIYELRLLDCTVRKNIYDLKHVWPIRVLTISESMSFLLTALVQFGEETELVDIYVGADLADIHVQLVAPFHLDPSQCIIQVFESKMFNEYVNLSKISLLNNMDSGRFRVILKKVDIIQMPTTPTNSNRSLSLLNLDNASPQFLNQANTLAHSFNSSQDNLSVSYKDHLDQMSCNDENDNRELDTFDSVEQPLKCQRDTKRKRDLDQLRELSPLPSSNILPAFPINIKYAISAGMMQSVIQDIVIISASHLFGYNISSKTHYAQIRAAFVKEYSMNEFKDNRDLDLLIQKLSRRLRDLRSRKKNKNCDEQFSLDWDNDRYQDGENQKNSSAIEPATTDNTNSIESKEFMKKLTDAFHNNEMTKGTTTQLIVESFRIRRTYLQSGQSMQQILNEMPFTQNITFIKLEFELVTKVSLMVATERIRKFLDNIISYEIYGKLPDENFLDEVSTMNLIPLLEVDNLSPLLYSCTHRNQTYCYLTYSNQILLDFDIQTDMAYVLTVLLAIFYVFDIKFPRCNKPILEIFITVIIHYLLLSTARHKCKMFNITLSSDQCNISKLIEILTPHIPTLRNHCINCQLPIPVISIADIAYLLVRNKSNKWTLAIDLNVYSKNQQFRLYNSVKHSKNNPHILSATSPFDQQPHLPFSNVLQKSLVSFIEDNKIPRIYFENKKIMLNLSTSSGSNLISTISQNFINITLINECIDNLCFTDTNNNIFTHSSYNQKQNNIDPSEPGMSIFISFVEKLITSDPRHQGYIYSSVRGNYNKNILFFNIGGNYRFCSYKNDHHRNNTVAIMINTKAFTYTIRCKDADCDNSILIWNKMQ